MGLEHLGGDARAADAEVLAIAAECLERAGRRAASCWRSATWACSPGWSQAAALTRGGAASAARARGGQGRRRACARCWPGAARRRQPVAERAGAADRARRATRRCSTRPQRALRASARRRAPRSRELRAVAERWRRPGWPRTSRSTSARCAGLDYYTGLVFRVYAPGLGFEVGGGGRYDTLLGALRPAHAGRRLHARPRPRGAAARAAGRGRPQPPRPAARSRRGGADARRRRSLARARAARRGRRGCRFGERGAAMSLTVALSKGKLLAGSEALFRQAGLPFPDGEGRRLVVPAGRTALPVRQGHGRADLRRVRRRRLRHRRTRRAARDGERRLRAARPGLRPLPRSWWRCPRGSSVRTRRAPRRVRVATKYPRRGRRHFQDRGVSVEVVRLAGSVEMAPGLGLADCIVDVVETGRTLEENGLEVDRGGGRLVSAADREPRQLPRAARRGRSSCSRRCGRRVRREDRT